MQRNTTHQLFFSQKLLLLLFCLQISSNVVANEPSNANNTTVAQPLIQAIKITQAPKIDGKLDDVAWQKASIIDNFTTFEPNPGNPCSQQTEVKIAYDNTAIYVCAHLFDEAPDSILKQLGVRDAISANADYFGVFFDTYNDDQNGFGFVVSAANVQSDAKYSASGEDWSWNGVWSSQARIVENGWIVEMKIPYQTLRFAKAEVQDWGLGFMRQIRRIRERSMWNIFDLRQDGFVQQWGTLAGLKGIEPPLRLSFSPYVSMLTQYHDLREREGNSSSSYNFRGGMDIKYGINESFTLDMVLIPDFGQVQTDDQILNLGPFEVRFNENRPFFMEGTELFNKAGIFYSRRVGGRPIDFYGVEDQLNAGEEIINNPIESQLYNATKISGRTPKGLGIGVFNAVTARTYAEVKDSETGTTRDVLTAPLTNYNVVVVDQNLKNASYVTLTNTHTWREGDFRDANVTAAQFRFANKKQSYAVEGRAILSQVFDASLDNKPDLGFKTTWEVAKIKGNLQFGGGQNVESDRYNPNDLGILFANNEIGHFAFVRYNIYKPFWRFNNTWSNVNINHSLRYQPTSFQNISLNVNAGGSFKNFLSVGFWLGANPVEGQDFFEPRQSGRFSITSKGFWGGVWLSSDYRKRLAIDAEVDGYRGGLYDLSRIGIRISPRFRVNDRLSFIYRSRFDYRPNSVGFAAIEDETDAVIYGHRQTRTVENILTANYIFTSRMGINLRARYYWSQVKYKQFHELQEDGYLRPEVSAFADNRDNNFNIFTIDFIYTWEFLTGSQLSFVWKNNIVYDDDNSMHLYGDNARRTFQTPQRNSFSIKLLYFLDYQQLKRWRR